MAAKRPVVNVYAADSTSVTSTVALPEVLVAPIRADIVRKVHTNLAKNHRQAYSVSEAAGHQTSAESWGTGRAVARIPRVSGGGTHRSGQGAFGNMCRKGRMFAPTKIWRKWHRATNLNERRVAVCSALAASAVPALVMARGHKIDGINEVPLVLSNAVESTQKTKDAIEILKKHNALADVQKVKDSKKIRAGKGKMRNRRYVQRRGPLVVYARNEGVERAFRNLPGIELANVERLNLLQLAPGGHLGRFIIWTQAAFEKLDSIFGTHAQKSEQKKKFSLPYAAMTNADVARIINSDEVQSKVNPAVNKSRRTVRKQNALKNTTAMLLLNPYASHQKREEAKDVQGLRKRKTLESKTPSSSTPKTRRAYYKQLTAFRPAEGTEPAAEFLASFNTVKGIDA